MVKLRRLTEGDLPFLLEIRNHPSTRYNLEVNKEFTLEECKEWFAKLEHPWYIIEVEGTKVGYFRTKGDWVGVDIHMDHRRKGYARAAYQEYLKDKEVAYLGVFTNNFALHLYTSLGFKLIREITVRGKNYFHMKWEKPNL